MLCLCTHLHVLSALRSKDITLLRHLHFPYSFPRRRETEVRLKMNSLVFLGVSSRRITPKAVPTGRRVHNIVVSWNQSHTFENVVYNRRYIYYGPYFRFICVSSLHWGRIHLIFQMYISDATKSNNKINISTKMNCKLLYMFYIKLTSHLKWLY